MASHFSQVHTAPFVRQSWQPAADGFSDRLLFEVVQTLRQLFEMAAFRDIQTEQIERFVEG